jgi:hypothetical protein
MGVAITVVGCLGLVVAYSWHVNARAERRAREFCDSIPIGSDILTATARASQMKINWGAYRGYTFYFSGVIFDKAVCEVAINKDGKVVSRQAQMEYD